MAFLDSIPQWIWFILDLLLVPIISVILEHKYSIIQRIHRLWCYVWNKEASIELVVWVESDKNFEHLKAKIKKSFNKKIEKILTENGHTLYIKTLNFNLRIRRHAQGIYIIESDRIRSGIQNIKEDVKELVFLIWEDKFSRDYETKNISLNLYLPYKWKYITTFSQKNYEMKDYEVKLKNNKYKSIVNISFEKINISNTHIEQLVDTFEDFTKIF